MGVLIQDVFLAGPDVALSDNAQRAHTALLAFVERIETQLKDQDYLCGEFSVADISVFLTVAFATTLGVAIKSASVQAWYERVLARPPIQAEFTAMMAGVAAL